MSDPTSITDTIRRGGSAPPVLDQLLGAATPIVRLGMWWRLRQTPVNVDAYVVSYGNLTTGGTGKTPAVIERAARELADGRRVAVLTRGYGSERTSEPIAETRYVPGETYRRLGDEPALILRNVPGIVVVKGRNRVDSARLAIESHGSDFLILDDGFQYTRLARDENVVLINAVNPFGNGHILPRGILREPIVALGRATEIVLTHCDEADGLDELIRTIRVVLPDAPIRKTRHEPSGLTKLGQGENLPVGWLQGKTVDVLCGIANPESFVRTLERQGARVAERTFLPDHATLPRSLPVGDNPLIVTEKDAARMKDANGNVYALAITLREIP